jgi:hypothetical protein
MQVRQKQRAKTKVSPCRCAKNSEQKLDARTVEFFVLQPFLINPRFHDDTLVGNLHVEGALPCYPLEPPAMALASSR